MVKSLGLAGLLSVVCSPLHGQNQTINGNLTVTGSIEAAGPIDSGDNTLTFGTQGSAFGGALLHQDNSTDTFTFFSNRNPASWLWQHTVGIAAMRLDASHQLILYKSDGTTVGLTLTPATSSIKLGTHSNGTLTADANGVITADGGFSVAGGITNTNGSLTGGTSGLTLNAGGANQNITLSPSGSGAVVVNGAVRATGTVATPAFSFTNDADSGVYSVADGELGISANGIRALGVGRPSGITTLTANGGLNLNADGALNLNTGSTNQNISFTPGSGQTIVNSSLYIGTSTAPADGRLTVKNGTSDPSISMLGRSTDGTSTLRFWSNTAATQYAVLQYYDNTIQGLALATLTDRPLLFKVNSGEAARFAHGSRNLLLGSATDSGNGRLQVAQSTDAYIATFTSTVSNSISAGQVVQISGSNNSTDQSYAANRAPGLIINNSSSTPNNYAGLFFQDAGQNGVAGVHGVFVDDATNHGALTFNTRASGSNYSEKVRLTGDGKLGIGTTSPSRSLSTVGSAPEFAVNGSNNLLHTYIHLQGTALIDNGAYSGPYSPSLVIQNLDNSALLQFSASTGYNQRIQAAGSGLDFYTGGTALGATNQALSLSSAGNVGIGTTTPATRLMVADDNVASGGITIGTGTAADGGNLRLLSSTNHWNLDNYTGDLRFFTETGYGAGGATRMTLTKEGNLNVGGTFTAANYSASGGAITGGSTGLTLNAGGASQNLVFAPSNAGNLTGGQTNVRSDLRFGTTGSAQTYYIAPATAGGAIQIKQDPATANRWLAFGMISNTPAWAEHMRITDAGNIGIGTTAPTSKLHIAGNRSAFMVQEQVAAMPDGSSYDVGGIIYSDGFLRDTAGSNPAAYLKIRSINTNSSWPTTIRGTQLEFGTADGAVGQGVQATTRLTVTPAGNVGIGTQNPVSSLHLSGAGDTQLTIAADSDNSGENDNPLLLLQQDGNLVNGLFGVSGDAGGLYSDALVNATFLEAKDTALQGGLQLVTGGSTIGGVNGTARLTILHNGNVGIGTTTPTEKLEVTGNFKVTGTFSAANYTVTSGAINGGNSGLVLNAGGTNQNITFSPSGTGKVRINATGNGGADARLLRLGVSQTAAGSSASLEFGSATYDALAQVRGGVESGQNGFLAFNTREGGNENERMRITSAGNVGIGTSSPSARLTVHGETVSSVALLSSKTGLNRELRLHDTDLNTGFVITSGNTIGDSKIGFRYFDGTSWSVPQLLIDGISGNVGIGTQTPSNTLDVRGSGARFDGWFSEATSNTGVYLGRNPSDNTPRILFANGNSGQNWQIDNNGGTFRWYLPGAEQMTLSGATLTLINKNLVATGSGNSYFAGNVGIGTATPGGLLGLGQRAAGLSAPKTYTAASGTQIDSYYTNSDFERYLDFVANGQDDGNPGGSLRFFTKPASYDAAPVERMRIAAGGNIGIGIIAPKGKLDVAHGTTNPQGLSDVPIDALRIEQGPGYGVTAIRTTAGTSPADGDMQFFNLFYNGTTYNWHERMRIKANGNVGIGTTAPTHTLSVAGTIRAQEIIVDNTNWADYVFEEDYRLAPLAEVESHIKEKGHLPGIPSASEVAERGVSMGEMQAKLLSKVEELTLHLIRMEKENTELRQRVQALETASTHP